MSLHDPRVSLAQMHDHAAEILSLIVDRQRADLDDDRLLALALARLLEIIGEAANRVPVDVRETYPGIPWSEIIGLRHRLAHGYDRIDHEILWEILTGDLPRLVEQLRDLEPPRT